MRSSAQDAGAEAEAGNNGEVRLLIVRSSDEISHDDR
jgi:hypothetical protein